jgi:tetratricopeptide (TPR) repeat protein
MIPGAAGALAVVALASSASDVRPIQTSRGQSEEAPQFVGSEACAECHEVEWERWRGSTHGRAGGPATAETVIAPFDGSPIQLADARVIPRVTGEGEYQFLVERPGRDAVIYSVDGVVGRGHMVGGGTQGFVSRFVDGTIRFLPFDWSRSENTWFCNTGAIEGWWTASRLASLRPAVGWVPITQETRLTDCGDWPPIRILGTDFRFANCQGCHGSQIRALFRPGEGYETEVASYTVNCESCHGPGGEHVQWAVEGALGRDMGLGLVTLAAPSEDESLETCFQCHALKRALREDYLPGDDFAEAYSLLLPLVGDRPFKPDGRVALFAYQLNHVASACYLDGNMTCTDCHDPHSQSYRDPSGSPLPGRFDDGQCTACHASKATEPSRHTRHADESEGSRCVACHMPYLQQPQLGEQIRYARSDHTIPIPRPAFDASLGVENACVQCHEDQSIEELEVHTREWWGEMKPHDAAVRGLLEAESGTAAEAATGPQLIAALDPPRPHPMVQMAALNLLSEGIRPDSGVSAETRRALERLAGQSNLDLRAVALATLHIAAGSETEVRSVLAGHLAEVDSAGEALRARWVAALGFIGEPRRQRGEIVDALLIFRKALEVDPESTMALNSMATMLARAGDPEGAVDYLQASLSADSVQPVAWVNLGIALEELGALQDAESAYQRAIDLFPHEPLAHMNLGNLRLREGNFDQAALRYRAALATDPGLARAHLYLGLAYLNLGREDQAEKELRSALEFAPDDVDAQRLLRELREGRP